MYLRGEPETETLVDVAGLSHRVEHLLTELQTEVAVLEQQPLTASHGLSQQAPGMGLLPLTHGQALQLWISNMMVMKDEFEKEWGRVLR